MFLKKSLKQQFRMPATSALFLVLFGIAAFFLCCGVNIWARNDAAIKAFESTFTTIGTVEQLPDEVEQVAQWDAGEKKYTYRSEPRYNSVIPVSVLDFEGANYIQKPEKRPYYGTYLPGIKHWWSAHSGWTPTFVGIISPVEDCVPNHPVELKVEKIYYWGTGVEGYERNEKSVVFCDHFNDNPLPMLASKKYIVALYEHGIHTFDANSFEYIPIGDIVMESTQYRSDGTKIESTFESSFYQEIEEGFFGSKAESRWMEFSKLCDLFLSTTPVLPTSNSKLLMPFLENEVAIAQGEDITTEEYEMGASVCLVPQATAEKNNLVVGDVIPLSLYYSNHSNAPEECFNQRGVGFGGSLINAQGKIYPVFFEQEYRIKGIYLDVAAIMGQDTIIIPAASVKESDENNILSYGPMKANTTSFQIPNGSIEDYMAAFEKTGFANKLEITFYDQGYSKLQSGLENMKKMSLLFLAIGAAMSVALVFFFCHVFIGKQKMRTAIERMLGMNERQCMVSLLGGFLTVAAIAIVLGCAIGFVASKQFTKVSGEGIYDTTFSSTQTGDAGQVETPEISVVYTFAAGGALFLLTLLVAVQATRKNVREEPLALLGSRRE